jgi:hypothetical protein
VNMATPIIRILGGPTVKPHPGLQQQPCSITGLSHLTDVHEADLIVWWWEDGVTRLPSKSERFGNALSSALQQEVKEFVRSVGANSRDSNVETDEISELAVHYLPRPAWLKDGAPVDMRKAVNRWLPNIAHQAHSGGPMMSRALLGRAFDEFMANALTAVRGGAVVFFVIPPTAKGYHAFTCLDIIQQLDLEWDPVVRPPTVNPDLPPAGKAAHLMAASLIGLIDDWPFQVGLRWAKRAPLEHSGEIECRLLFPACESAGPIRFAPAATTRQGHARALMLQLVDHAGAMFVIPPTRTIDSLIQTYRDIRAPGEATDIGTGKTAASRGRGRLAVGVKSMVITTKRKKISGQREPGWLVTVSLTDGTELPVRMGFMAFRIFMAFVLASQTNKTGASICLLDPKIGGQPIKDMLPRFNDTDSIYRTYQYVDDAFDTACLVAKRPDLKIRLVERLKSSDESATYRLRPDIRTRINAKTLGNFLKAKTMRTAEEERIWTLYRYAGKILT